MKDIFFLLKILGVPNILSDDNIFLRDERQKPINKKRLEVV